MKQPVRKSVAEANNIDTSKKIYSVIIDGNNLLKISLVDKRMNCSGEEYGGVFMFLKMLGSILLKKDFDYCYVCWDGEGSGVLRYQHYKDYKANRDKHYDMYDKNKSEYDKFIDNYCKKVIEYSRAKRGESVTVRKETDDESFDRQKMILQQILEELCVRQCEFENVEGDDLISYLVKHKHDNERTVIVSSDRDLTQLISDTTIVYNPRIKDFITKDNSVKMLGITHENIVVEKIICGDVSDNIKGIKGIGEHTLRKHFPEIINEKTDIDTIIRKSKALLEERKQQKKKPLKAIENIINKVTDGIQGKDIYEINRKIIDLSEPLVTEEAKKELDDIVYSPIDTDDRTIKNVYKIIEENGMDDLTDEGKFGDILAPYSRIMMMEKNRFEEFKKKS